MRAVRFVVHAVFEILLVIAIIIIVVALEKDSQSD